MSWDEAAARAMEERLLDTDELRRLNTTGQFHKDQAVTINLFAVAVDNAVAAAGRGNDPLLALRDSLVRICRDHARLTDEAFARAQPEARQ